MWIIFPILFPKYIDSGGFLRWWKGDYLTETNNLISDIEKYLESLHFDIRRILRSDGLLAILLHFDSRGEMERFLSFYTQKYLKLITMQRD